MSPAARSRIMSWLLIIGALVVLVLVIWRPLVGWFTGEPTDRGETSAVSRVTAGPIVVEAALRPDPPAEKGNTLVLVLRDAGIGAPIEDADITATYVMPAMGSMPEMRGTASIDDKGDGRYHARFDLPMGGSWTLEVRAKTGTASGTARYQMTVGTSGLKALGGGGTRQPEVG